MIVEKLKYARTVKELRLALEQFSDNELLAEGWPIYLKDVLGDANDVRTDPGGLKMTKHASSPVDKEAESMLKRARFFYNRLEFLNRKKKPAKYRRELHKLALEWASEISNKRVIWGRYKATMDMISSYWSSRPQEHSPMLVLANDLHSLIYLS